MLKKKLKLESENNSCEKTIFVWTSGESTSGLFMLSRARVIIKGTLDFEGKHTEKSLKI
jgi:hypothetical protein